MGCLIDPEEQTIFVFRPQQEIQVVDDPDELLPVPSFANELKLTVKELFAWLWE